MDKAEYHEKLDELTGYVQNEDFKEALKTASEVDWRRVKSIRTLNMVADVYEVNKDYEREKEILKIAYSRSSIGRSILYRLVETCLRLGDVDGADRYFNEFSKISQNDNSRCILQYKLYKAKRAPLDAQIAVLEEYREREYTERWAYELALLYSRAGETQKCVDACDDLILWFSEGKYVIKAMELKMKYQPLSPSQQVTYENEKTAYASSQPLVGSAAARRAVLEANSAAATAAAAGAAMGAAASGIRPEEEEQSSDKRTFEERSLDLKDKLTRSLHDAFSGMSLEKNISAQSEEEEPGDQVRQEAVPESAEEAVPAGKPEPAEEAAPAEPAAAAEIHKAEKQEAVRSTAPVRNAAEVIAEAADSAQQQEQPETVPPQAEAKDFNLEKFLSETAGSFSEEIAAGDFEEQEELPEEPVEELPEAEKTGAEEVQTGEEQTAEVPTEEAPTEELPETAEVPAEELPETAEKQGAEEQEAEIPKEEPETGASEEADAALKEIRAEGEPEAESPAAEPEVHQPHYNPELEVPDPEPTKEEKMSRTIPLNKVGQNTVPISLDKVLREETPEERRIRILNKARPTRMSDDQRKIFTYFARIPGIDSQVLEALNAVYEHAGEKTSMHGNIAVMGAKGTGKTRLTHGLIVNMCQDMGLEAAKIARIRGAELNKKDPAKVVGMMSGGFLVIENVSGMDAETVEKLNRALEFRTDCMILIIEDEKAPMRAFLKQYPDLAAKIEKVISIPVFTNDELVTFARTYATENGCKLDDLGILALYTLIGNSQTEEEPVTISFVKEMIDSAIHKASRGRRRPSQRVGAKDSKGKKEKWLILHEKDFEKK